MLLDLNKQTRTVSFVETVRVLFSLRLQRGVFSSEF